MRSAYRVLGALAQLLTGKRRGVLSYAPRLLRFETCEDRSMLATFTVTSLGDGVVTGPGDQPGTLRQAIFDANDLAGPDVIQFDLSLNDATITLTERASPEEFSSALLITDAVTIDASMLSDGITIDASGNDSDPLTVDGGGTRIFRIQMGPGAIREVSLKKLTLTGGDSFEAGGAIHVLDGNDAILLSLEDCTLQDNHGTFGGGIWMQFGGLELIRTVIAENSAQSDGGGLWFQDPRFVTITNSQILDNDAGNNGGGLWAK